MSDQGAEQHEKFTAMPLNTMNPIQGESTKPNHKQNARAGTQCNRGVEEELQTNRKLIHDKQGKLFERKGQEMQKKQNEKAERFQSNQEQKLKTKANEIESELLNQAQSLLDSCPWVWEK